MSDFVSSRSQADVPLLEICVDSPAGLTTALEGGADRIELCSALSVGGLTASSGLMAQAAQQSRVPVHALIRPRAGDFVYDGNELTVMVEDIQAARDMGLSGIVIGASCPDGRLDMQRLERLCRAAEGVDITLHRAFDLVPDFSEALKLVRSLGIGRILTSGGQISALEGINSLEWLVEKAGQAISIMPGGGVNAGNAARFLGLGVCELHASCSAPLAASDPRLCDLGFLAADARMTDMSKVAALKSVMAAFHLSSK